MFVYIVGYSLIYHWYTISQEAKSFTSHVATTTTADGGAVAETNRSSAADVQEEAKMVDVLDTAAAGSAEKRTETVEAAEPKVAEPKVS